MVQVSTLAGGQEGGLSKPAISCASVSEVRAFSAEDLPMVARLFKRTFRAGASVPAQSIESYFKHLFLEGPDFDPDFPSLVHVTANGEVSGFLGALVQPMTLGTKQVRAMHACAMMVADPHRDALAAARLLRSVIKKPDFSFSETSNASSTRMWTSLGGRTIPAYSLTWVRPLRPFGTAIAASSEKLSALRLLHPVGALADWIVSRAKSSFSTLPAPPPGYHTIEVDSHEIVDVINQLVTAYALRPVWSPGQLASRLEHARHMPAYGDLVCGKVINRRGALAGAYLYYSRRNSLARVLQVLTRNQESDAVFVSLLRDAKERGVVAVSGRAEPNMLNSVLHADCILLNRGFTNVYSKDKEILDATAKGDAMLTGLAGECWSHLRGGLTS